MEHFARTLAIRARDDQRGSQEDVTFLADCATLLDDIAEDVADWANAETPILAPSRTEANENDLATQGSRQLSELADRVRALPPAQVTYSGAMLIAIEQILEALHDRAQPEA